MNLIVIPIGLVGTLGLLLLPGAWIAFGPLAAGVSFWPRVWLTVALSPIVVMAQFYALRLVGIPFGATAWVLMVLNLWPARRLLREARGAGGLPRDTWIPVAVVGVVVGALFSMYLGPRLISGHSWMHADIVYQLAGGMLRPEEAAIAGVKLGYPWFGHIQQAAFSWVMDAPPVATYLWPNALWLTATLGLIWCTMTELGSASPGKVWSLFLLLFAVNFCGYVVSFYLPPDFVQRYPIIGDWRYTPWIRKFFRYNQQTSAEMLFGAMLLLAVNKSPERDGLARWGLLTLLLASIGVFYPLLFPAACGLVGSMGLVFLLDEHASARDMLVRRIGSLAAMGVLAAGATLAATLWWTQDRAASPGITLTDLYYIKIKGATSALIMLPLLPGCAWLLWSTRRERPHHVLLLVLAGVWCTLLYVMLSLIGPADYKFVFPAVAAFTPVAALAMDRVMPRLGRAAWPVTLAGLFVFASAAYYRAFTEDHLDFRGMELDARHFAMRLGPDEPLARVTDAVRDRTPPNTIVVTNDTTLHMSTVVQRSIFAPYTNFAAHGINVREDWLLETMKGYAPSVLSERRAILTPLFESTDESARVQAFAQLRAMAKPLAFVVHDDRAPLLSPFLARQAGVVRLLSDKTMSVWLAESR